MLRSKQKEGPVGHRLTNEDLFRTAHGFDEALYLKAYDIEVRASRDIMVSAPDEILTALGAEVHDIGPSTLFVAPKVPQVMFNRVQLVAPNGELDRHELEACLDIFAGKGVTRYLLQVDPRASNDDTRQLLAERQLVPYRRPWVKLARGNEPLPDVGSDLEVIDADPSRSDSVAELLLEGFNFPASAADLYRHVVGRSGWSAYLAQAEQEPAAVGLAYLHGTSCYLAGGATRQQFRRRSAQRALMHRRIADAISHGAELIATETGVPLPTEENPSYRNMIHLGFRAVGTRDNYGPNGTTW